MNGDVTSVKVFHNVTSLGALGLEKKHDKSNQNYCASDAPSLCFSHVSKTSDC